MRSLAAMTPARVVIPRRWPEATVVCLATGPSLTPEDVAHVQRAHVPTIAINDAFRLAPWADVLYACDLKWWDRHRGVPEFHGVKYACRTNILRGSRWPDVQVLTSTGRQGFDADPSAIRDGHNSGYQAIHVAVHSGASRVVLLGYDMQVERGTGREHYFGRHPDGTKPPFPLCLVAFRTLATALAARGVDVVNCTPTTALHCFRQQPLREVLPC